MPSGLGVALNMVDLDSGPEDIHHRGAELCLGGDGVGRPCCSGSRGRNGKRGDRRRGSRLDSRGRGGSGYLGLARVGAKVRGRGILVARSEGILVVIGDVVVIGRLVFLECGRRSRRGRGRGYRRGRRSWVLHGHGSRSGGWRRDRHGRCRGYPDGSSGRRRWRGNRRGRSGRGRGSGGRSRSGLGLGRSRRLGADERNLARAKGGRHGGIENRLHIRSAKHQANERTTRGQAKRQGRAVIRQRGHVKQQSATRGVALDDAIDDALPRALEIAGGD